MSSKPSDSNARPVTLPIPAEWIERMGALTAYVASRPDYAPTGFASRAAVHRLALLRGIEVLEREAAKRAGK